MAILASNVSFTDLTQLFTTYGTDMSPEFWAINGSAITELFKLKHTLLDPLSTDENYIKVIPYVTITKQELVGGSLVTKYLTRTRNDGDDPQYGENTLAWDGYIKKISPPGANISARVFITETIRTIHSLLGVALLDFQVAAALQNAAYSFYTAYSRYQPGDEHGKYSLCVNIRIELLDRLQRIRPNDQLSQNVEWYSKAELQNKIANEEYTLEPWSQVVLNQLT